MIRVEGLNLRRGAGLCDVSVHVHRGDVIALIGPSGSGKSALLRCLNHLETPDSGEIWVNGVNICDPAADLLALRRKTGMVFQEFTLFPHLMAVENIMLGPVHLQGKPRRQAYDDALALLALVGLQDKAHAFPDELSGGQQQRVEIARAMAMQPSVILFDEPTSALDPTMVSEVFGVIRLLASQGLTMLIATHEMRFAREVANRVLFMSDGRLYEDGPPSQIFEAPQHEKTRDFIHQIQELACSIRDGAFDNFGFFGRIEEFGFRQGLERRQVNSIMLIIEELVQHSLLQHTGEIDIRLRYDEKEREARIHLTYGGDAFDPFEDPRMDELSRVILAGYVRDHSHRFDGQNHLDIQMQ